jgi:CRP-like cAMP-binding protein
MNGTRAVDMVTKASNPLQAFVSRLTMRSKLTEDEIETLLGLPTTPASIPANRDFVFVRDETDHCYLVVTGIVGRFSQERDGSRQMTALHIPGDMADLCSVVFPKSSWTFQALAASTVLCIPHAALRQAANDHPGIAAAFWRDCVVDMSIMSEGMLTLSRRSGEAKIAHLLCEMSCRYRGAGSVDDDHFDWHLRQGHVADVVGLTPVHVNRMLRAIREKGLATVTLKEAKIHNFAGLAKLARFDPTYLHLPEDSACSKI